MNTKDIREAALLIKQGMSVLDGGPLEYYLDRLSRCYDFLLTFAPYQPGARVRLIKTPEIHRRERWGWLGGKHFLQAGAMATVRSVSADGAHFSYGLEFDEDSWIDHMKVIHPYPPEERHEYSFDASWFEGVTETVTGDADAGR